MRDRSKRAVAVVLGTSLVFLVLPVLLGCSGAVAPHAEPAAVHRGPGLGQPASPEALALARVGVLADGSDLPRGRGTAVEGEAVYVANCLRCHGLDGAGNPADRLVGGVGSLSGPRPIKTVGSYWPLATTVFDYIKRAMPYDRPGVLSDDEVYALTAYLLAQNGIIDATAEMNAETLPKVIMPNRDGFVSN